MSELDRRKCGLLKATAIEMANSERTPIVGGFNHSDRREYCVNGMSVITMDPEKIEQLLAKDQKKWGQKLRPVKEGVYGNYKRLRK
ncbi:MAG: hypothetical protein E6713_06075 [Sporomusaceae bacterium]|nr:hypothetical protein [Sporomusaceae bacterium]